MVWLLTLVVLLPTACVFWFMTQAMQNERLAVQQKLIDVYQGQLAALGDQLDDYWAQQTGELADTERSSSASEAFALCVESDLADSLIVSMMMATACTHLRPAPAPLITARRRGLGHGLRASNRQATRSPPPKPTRESPIARPTLIRWHVRCRPRPVASHAQIRPIRPSRYSPRHLAQESYAQAVDARGGSSSPTPNCGLATD